MKKIVTGFVMSVPNVAPIFETRIKTASGTEIISCNPKGIKHPINIPSAQPAATLSGGRGSRTIFRLRNFKYPAIDDFTLRQTV
jgi:hypothetical protein